MSTDTELEALLRATLGNRAATVQRGPGLLNSLALVPSPPPRRGRVWLPALAAAAAVAVIAVGVAVAVDSHHHTPPAGQTTSPAPTPSPTVTRSVSVSAACQTTLPTAWTSAVGASVLSSGGLTAMPLSVTPDGAVLAIRSDGVTPGSQREVVELRAAQAPKILYTVPDPDTTTVASAELIGTKWLALGLADDPRPKKGTEPGSSPIGLSSVVLFDLDNGHGAALATAQNATGGLSITNTIVFAGKIYWTERASYGASTGTVRSYDPTTGVFATVYRGSIGYLAASPAGVEVNPQTSPQTVVAGTLPGPVEAAMTSFSRFRLASDGSAYAWVVDPNTMAWWQPGMTTPTMLRVPGGLDTDDGGGTPLVAGRFVVTSPNGDVIDMVSHAIAPIPAGDFGGLQRAEFDFGADRVLGGLAFADQAGRFVGGYWEDTPIQILRLDTAALPGLTC